MKKGFFLLNLMLFIYPAFGQEIKNVNFVQEGEVSKLIIETDKEVVAERFHVTEDKQIILDLKNVTVSPKLLRGIDTSEFPGSTVYISGYKKPGTAKDIRFAIQLRDNVRSILDKKGNTISLNIENRFGVFNRNQVNNAVETKVTTLEEDAVGVGLGLRVPKSNSVDDILTNLTMSGPKKYVGKRITISVREIPIRDLLNMIADTSGFNIIIDDAVNKVPPLTLTLTNVPWDQALDTIMTLSKLVAQKSSNILIMKTVDQLTKEKEEEIAQSKIKLGLEPLVTRIFPINYASLGDISKILVDYLTPAVGKVQVDDRTNSLIVKDTVDSIERIKKIIETLDTQTPQILIEAKIVEANENYSKTLGLTNGLNFGYDPLVDAKTIVPAGPGFTFSSGGADPVLGLTIGVFKRLAGLNFRLQMAENEQKGRIISSPRVITQNKKEASITSSEETSFPRPPVPTIGATAVNPGFDSKTAELSLKVKPQVTNDGSINLDITLSKGSFGTIASAGAPPNLNKRTVTTAVLIENGSTVVLGGLYPTNDLETIRGIPVLKDLPLIGWLFRQPVATTRSKTELIIFLTPRILNQEEAGFSGQATAKPADSIVTPGRL